MALFDELFSAQANFFRVYKILDFASNYLMGTSQLDIGIQARIDTKSHFNRFSSSGVYKILVCK